ncbi:MAG: AAA family ATPase [Gammaproteobacteria bacterium]
MYLEHFGLTDQPFRLTSDPRFLYLSESHARVKAYIDYATRIQDSFVIFTGEIGSGKTTLIQDAISRMPDNVVIAKIHQTQLTENEFLQAILVEFGFQPYHADKVELLEQLCKFFIQQNNKGNKVLLIVDEAQNLTRRVLEEIRLLSDLERDNKKLLNVILLGQPELNDTLDAPDMENLMQRVRLRFHIGALTLEDTQAYIQHRLRIAGATNEDIFSTRAISLIHEFTGGRPRLINILCDYALTTAFIQEQSVINDQTIRMAVEELQWVPYAQKYTTPRSQSAAAARDTKVARIIMRHEGKVIGKFPVNREFLNIGRKADNDICLDDKLVSRYHAQVFTNHGNSFLRDLNSSNGTYVEDSKVDLLQLREGMHFLIGGYSFTYVTEDASNQSLGEDPGEFGKILKYKPKTRPSQAAG